MSIQYILLYKEICLPGIYSSQCLQMFRALSLQKHGFHRNIHNKLSIYTGIRTEKTPKKQQQRNLLAELLLKWLAFESIRAFIFLDIQNFMLLGITSWFIFHSQPGFSTFLVVLLVLVLEKMSNSYFINCLLAGITLFPFLCLTAYLLPLFSCPNFCSFLGFSRLYELLQNI